MIENYLPTIWRVATSMGARATLCDLNANRLEIAEQIGCLAFGDSCCYG